MIKVYRDDEANSVFLENANGAQFLNSLQAEIVDTDKVTINDLARQISVVSAADHSQFVQEDDTPYPGTPTEVCDELNAVFAATGTPSNEPPVITSNLAISLVEGQTVNYELTADYGVGYEWDLSNVPGITTVEGNTRKIIGGSSLAAGEYAIPVKAINYNGEDSEIIELSIGTPPFANTKSVQFNNNDYLGANAGILDPTLGRSSNGSGLSDAWSITCWFKGGTAINASQTIFYFGNQDVANQGHMQLKYNGSLNRLEFRYGTNNNRLNFATNQDTLPANVWKHIVITYDGGTTGNQQGQLADYYSRFTIYLDGVEVPRVESHNNYGYTGSVIGQNLRVGRYNNGQNLRNNCKVDELAVYNDDISNIVPDIYNSGVPVDLSSLSTQPEHWWRMGDGDFFPYLFDYGFQANCIFIMSNMTAADIVSDVP